MSGKDIMNNPTFTRDPDGREVAHVRLGTRKAANSAPKFAKLDRADYEALIADGWSGRWYLNNSGNGYTYVNVADGRHKGSSAPVVRLLENPGRGRIVTYADADRLNLRRSNLVVTTGNAAGKTPVDDGDGTQRKMAQKSEGAYDE